MAYTKQSSKLGNMGLGNLNNNLICSIDTETTGLEAYKHNLIEIAAVPLNAKFEPITKVDFEDGKGEVPLYPFDRLIRLKRPQYVDPGAMKVNKIKLEDLELHGGEPYRVAEDFVKWFHDLQLITGKQIVPLAKNWAFDSGFIKEWLGVDTFNIIFNHRVRELSAVINFINDRFEFKGLRVPFPKQGLQEVASQLGIVRERQHRSLDDALITARIYHDLMLMYIKEVGDA